MKNLTSDNRWGFRGGGLRFMRPFLHGLGHIGMVFTRCRFPPTICDCPHNFDNLWLHAVREAVKGVATSRQITSSLFGHLVVEPRCHLF